MARRRRQVYDRRAVYEACTSTDPEVLEQVAGLDAYLLAMPPVPLCVEPTTHRHLIGQYLIDGLVQFFSPPARFKKPSYMSNGTFKLVCEKAVVNHAKCNVSRMLASATAVRGSLLAKSRYEHPMFSVAGRLHVFW